jgi:hypothetical protein
MYIYNKINYMSKIIRLTESDLIRLVKRVIEEQAPESVYDFDKEEKQRLSRRNNNNTPSMPEKERLGLENIRDTVIPQLKKIFHNFNKINCDELSSLGLSGDYNRGGDFNEKTPEYAIIYCKYYKGKTRNDIHNMIKNHEIKISSL